MDQDKIEAIVSWERSKNASEIGSFLGLAGYYRRFVQGSSSIAVPLMKLTQENVQFVWTDKCEASF